MWLPGACFGSARRALHNNPFGGLVGGGGSQVQDLVEQLTGEQVAFGREVGAMVVKNSKWGRRLVDIWLEAGTGDGCRYRKFPFNHMSQNINLDMPWWWFAQVKILGEFYNTTIPCLDPCAGPDTYVDNLSKAGNWSEVKVINQQWIAPCYDGILDLGFVFTVFLGDSCAMWCSISQAARLSVLVSVMMLISVLSDGQI